MGRLLVMLIDFIDCVVQLLHTSSGSSLGAKAEHEAYGEKCADGRHHHFAGVLRFGRGVVVHCYVRSG